MVTVTRKKGKEPTRRKPDPEKKKLHAQPCEERDCDTP
jgi:hypothetical protein